MGSINTISFVYEVIFVMLLGVSVGSFLNVVIYRVPKEISIFKGRSMCTNCNQTISAKDLIPVISYILLGGKCRHCKAKISPKYPLIEGLTAFLFFFIYLKYGTSVEFFAFAFLTSILVAVFFIDLEHMIIPDGLVITGLLGGVFILIFHLLVGFSYYGENVQWYYPVMGFLVNPIILIGIAIIGSFIMGGNEVMGGGDIKIYAPIGIFLGWKMALFSLFVSFFLGGAISAILLLFRKKRKENYIPFGPFIVIAVYLTILFGPETLEWYLNIGREI